MPSLNSLQARLSLLVELMVDDLLLPHEVGLGHGEDQLVEAAQIGVNAARTFWVARW